MNANEQITTSAQVVDLPLESITPSFGNDRTSFDESALQELADSIRTNGLAQPITVRPVAEGKYQLIAGERRYRAHKLLNAPTIRAIVTPMDDDRAAAVMLVENTGRKDLDPIDEARAYARRRDDFKWDEKTIAERAGVGIQTVRNRLALLALRSDLQDLVKTGTLPLGYALVIATAGLDNNRQMIALKDLNANPAPSVAWLRGRCSELGEAQAQSDMFDTVLFSAAEFAGVTRKAEFDQKLPADPRKDKAPAVGKTYRAMLQSQVEFWKSAAAQWDGYGKPAQRDRCLAAMSALQSIVDLMPARHNGHGKSMKAADGKTYIVYEAAV
jgi:ParB/RepB/Spo0J family partition protein